MGKDIGAEKGAYEPFVPAEGEPLYPTEESQPHGGIDAFHRNIGERRRMIIIHRKGRIETIRKGKKGERLYLDEGTRDELPPLVGRVYTPPEGIEVRDLPPEKRDSKVLLKTIKGQLFFAVKDAGVVENGVPYFEGFVLQKGENKGDSLTVMARGYARNWDIQGNKQAAD